MLSLQVKFSTDRQKDGQTDRWKDRRTPVKQYAPTAIRCGGIKISLRFLPKRKSDNFKIFSSDLLESREPC